MLILELKKQDDQLIEGTEKVPRIRKKQTTKKERKYNDSAPL
jgi:hypothetical protein